MQLWMVDPEAYDVAYAINPHMAAHQGGVDRPRARRQWDELVRIFRGLGAEVAIVPAVAGLPDLVFAANSCAAIRPGVAVLSRMAYAERAPEVPVVAAWLAARGWELLPAPPEPLEGYGDLRAVPGAATLLGGHGFRSTPAALRYVAEVTGREVIPLRLVDPRLYHLDTAITPLRPGLAAWVPSAFDAESADRIRSVFPTRIEIGLPEALGSLAANGVVLGETVVLEASAVETARQFRQFGFAVIPAETSEFLKSGGSVFCLTQVVGG